MLNFKITTGSFLIIIFIMIILQVIFLYPFFYFLIPIIFYFSLLFVGSKNICSQFYLESTCVSEDKSKVHLTFDDGPHPKITNQILEVLRKYNQKAIFFCIGKQIERHPEIIQNIIDDGHEIANHTYSHSIYFDFARTSIVIEEIERTNRLILQYTGKPNQLFRPPFGVTNPNIAKALLKTEMKTVGWSIRSLDTIKSKDQVLKRLQKAKPGDIILLHDTKQQTPEILEEFLRSMKCKFLI
jgi:peptidoglycan/xylan/chitin deacetylase (PgdA/CDA1 family)